MVTMVIEEAGGEAKIWKQVQTLEPPTTLLYKTSYIRTIVRDEQSIIFRKQPL